MAVVWVVTRQTYWHGTDGEQVVATATTRDLAKKWICERHDHSLLWCDFCFSNWKWTDKAGYSEMSFDNDGVGVFYYIRKFSVYEGRA